MSFINHTKKIFSCLDEVELYRKSIKEIKDQSVKVEVSLADKKWKVLDYRTHLSEASIELNQLSSKENELEKELAEIRQNKALLKGFLTSSKI